ncbi:MAG: hypothetical protein ACTS68_00750 [Candidatus Hodgkinia cicadicola]
MRGRFSHFDRSCNVHNTSVPRPLPLCSNFRKTITAICLNNLTFHQYLQLFPRRTIVLRNVSIKVKLSFDSVPRSTLTSFRRNRNSFQPNGRRYSHWRPHIL